MLLEIKRPKESIAHVKKQSAIKSIVLALPMELNVLSNANVKTALIVIL